MVSAALQPNLANVSTAFILCSALYILMALLVLFLVQDFRRSSGLCFLLGGFSGYVSCAVSYERIHSGVIAPISLPGKS